MISELPFKSTIPELGKIIDGIEKAGEKILEVYETDFSTEKKEDDSPITQADIESNKILKEVLKRFSPRSPTRTGQPSPFSAPRTSVVRIETARSLSPRIFVVL